MNDYTIKVTSVADHHGGGWQAELLDEDGDSIATHVRSSLAAAVCAVTIELSDLVEPYED
ncbi:hypothetical protein [Rhodopirellula bahusiensis]|uniref:hypothetical protein n=1 Tax=Rhodopirellula bahusiensis TaxID=2014065 RepID=UPI0032676435